MTNIEKINKYLRVLVEVNESFEILTKNFPDLLEDLVSSKNSPSCSCNDRVIKGLTQKYQEDDEARMIIDDIFSRVQVVEAIRAWDEAIERWQNQEKEVFGKVHVIGESSEDWNNFRNFIRSQGIHIQGFSVIEKEDVLEIRFI